MAWVGLHDSNWNPMYSGRVYSWNHRMSEFIQQQHQYCHWRDAASTLLESYCTPHTASFQDISKPARRTSVVRAGALAGFQLPSLAQLLGEPWGTKTVWWKQRKPLSLWSWMFRLKMIKNVGLWKVQWSKKSIKRYRQPHLGTWPMKPGRISKNAPCGPIQTHGAPTSTQHCQSKTEVQTLQTRIFLNACQEWLVSVANDDYSLANLCVGSDRKSLGAAEVCCTTTVLFQVGAPQWLMTIWMEWCAILFADYDIDISSKRMSTIQNTVLQVGSRHRPRAWMCMYNIYIYIYIYRHIIIIINLIYIYIHITYSACRRSPRSTPLLVWQRECRF